MLLFTLIFCIIAAVRAVEIDDKFKAISKKKVDQLEVYEDSKMCLTVECYNAALDIRQNMNISVNPCENFYKYACDGFAASNPIPSTELSWGTFEKMRSKIRHQLLDLITEPIQSTDIVPVKKAKKFYASCLHEVVVNYRLWKHIKAFLALTEGWPLIMDPEESNIQKHSWQKINQFYSRLIFMSPIYRIRVIKDPREQNSLNTSKVIQILPPMVPLHKLAVYTGKIFNNLIKDMYDDGTYASFIILIGKIMARRRNATIPHDHMAKDVNKIIQLEKKFLSIYDNVTAVQYATIDELQEIYNNASITQDKPNIDWKKLLTEHFAEADVQLDGNEVFQISNIKHFEVLSDILENSDPRAIVNYMQWVFVSHMLPFTTYDMQRMRNELFNDKEGISKPRKRWQDCLRSVSMPHVFDYMYLKKYFNDDATEEAKKLFANVQKEMKKHILEADWLTEEIKNVAVEKINKMNVLELYINKTLLANLYREAVIGNDYMENIISIKHFHNKKFLQLLKSEEVDAFYKKKQSISVADLQAPLFSLFQPNYLNYGELGVLIGHEVFQKTVDYVGQKYLWSGDNNKTLEGRVQCFADQYKNFYADDKSKQIESEQKTLFKNLADSLGLDIAFGAFQQIEKEKQSLHLPGFSHLSNENMFFLSFAKLWCSNIRHLKGKRRHSIPDYLVNGPLQNSKHFAKVFDCPQDSPMNPNLKCKLW